MNFFGVADQTFSSNLIHFRRFELRWDEVWCLLVDAIRFSIVIVSLMLATHAEAIAQQKRDLAGVELGMTWEAMQAKHPAMKCDVAGCKSPSGRLKVSVGGKQDSRIAQLELIFESGLSPRQMIDEVSRQYALKSEKINETDIKDAMRRRWYYNPDYGRVVPHVGGTIANWKGPGGLEVQLAINQPTGGAVEYILRLTDTEIIKSARAAEDKSRLDREAEKRKTNLTPKF